jgi:hypothetical protein
VSSSAATGKRPACRRQSSSAAARCGIPLSRCVDRRRGGQGAPGDPAVADQGDVPVLHNPKNLHRAVPITPGQFHYAFTNTLTAETSQEVYDRYALPTTSFPRRCSTNYKKNARHSDAITAYRLFPGRDHYMCGEEGGPGELDS